MAKLALYQKYRSTTFDEVVGQEYVVQSIKNAVRENKVGHAYLFCGPRGTGKTTMARILAKAVNCEHPEIAPCNKCENCIAANNGTHPDIIEINAANETHVEDIRDLIDRSQLAPMQGKHKVYIIDEVHQLSSAASSALLKTLEEPPENVIFILATTDPQKLLPTIISRCQRFDFTSLRKDQIHDHLMDIARKENIQMESEAADMIAELSDGGMRDALSIMDQCASYTDDHITAEAIDRIYGLTSADEKVDLLKDIADENLESIINRIHSYEKKGIDLQRFTDGLIDILKETVIYARTSKEELLKTITKDQALSLSASMDVTKCMHICEKLIDAKIKFRTASNASMVFEVTCLSLAVEKEQPVQIVSRETISNENKTEPVKTTVPPVKEEKKEEPVIQTEEIPVVSQDKIISLLVSCNKPSKVHDENTWAMLDSITDVKNRKYTSLLKSTKIGASGEDCILVITQSQAVANRINDEKMNQELYFFLKDRTDTDKMLYAITEDDFKTAVQSFASKMKAGTLPEPLKIKKWKKEEKEEENESEKKVKELFGSDHVEVI